MNLSFILASNTLRQLARSSSSVGGRPLERSPKFYVNKRNYSDSKKSEDCERPLCDEDIIRMDASFNPSAYFSKHYQKHWVDCPEPPKPIKLSCEDYTVPPHEVFRRKKRPLSATESSHKKLILSNSKDCQSMGESVCRKLSYSNCNKMKNPPKCTKKYVIKKCEKTLVPNLSYSETNRFKVPDPKNECTCFRAKSICVFGNEVQ